MASMRPKPWETAGHQVGDTSIDTPGETLPVLPPKPEGLSNQQNNSNQTFDNTSTANQSYSNAYSNPYSSYGGMGSYSGMSRYGMGATGGYGSTYGMGAGGGLYGGGGYGSNYGMGGMYGGSGYGMGLGGGMPGMGGLSDSTNQALSLLESLLLTFSSLTTLLESTYYATNNAVMSIGGVMGQIGAVSGVIGGVGAVFKDMGGEFGNLIKSVLRIVVKLIIKMLRLIGLDGFSGDSVNNLSRVGWLKSKLILMLKYLGLDDEIRTGSGKERANMVNEFIKWKNGNQSGMRGLDDTKKRKGKLWPLIVLIAAVFSVPILMKRIAEYHERRQTSQQQLQSTTQHSQQQQQQQTKGLITSTKTNTDPRELTFAKAKYAFKPEDSNSNELELNQNDLVAVLNEDSGDWWYCRSRDGRIGYVPKNWLLIVKKGGPSSNPNSEGKESLPVSQLTPTLIEPIKSHIK